MKKAALSLLAAGMILAVSANGASAALVDQHKMHQHKMHQHKIHAKSHKAHEHKIHAKSHKAKAHKLHAKSIKPKALPKTGYGGVSE